MIDGLLLLLLVVALLELGMVMAGGGRPSYIQSRW
jgi:hypothetical protein